MTIIKNEVRPVGYCILEFTEEEIQVLVSLFEDMQVLKQRSFDDMPGIRGEIYKNLCTILSTTTPTLGVNNK